MKLAAMPAAKHPDSLKSEPEQAQPVRPRAEKPSWAWAVIEREDQSAAEDPEDMWDNMPV